MTYTKKEISDLVIKETEEMIIDIQGFPSSAVLGVLYEKPEISFVLHEGNPNDQNFSTNSSRTYILITFKPQENQITQVTSILQAQTKLAEPIRIEGLYKIENGNKIVYAHTLSTGAGHYRTNKNELKWITVYHFVSEEKVSRIVEPNN